MFRCRQIEQKGPYRENGRGAFWKQQGSQQGQEGDSTTEHGSASGNSHSEPNKTQLPF